MYQIIQDGRTIALVADPVFITLSQNGSYVPTTEDKARGISIDSTPYHLLGREELPGLPTVMAVPVDGGAYFFSNQEDMKSQLQQADDAAIELYEAHMAQEEINAAQDDALIEIYERLEA